LDTSSCPPDSFRLPIPIPTSFSASHSSTPTRFHYTKGIHIYMDAAIFLQKALKEKRRATRRKTVHNMSSEHEVMIFI
jgi:hypothetical protein